MYLSFDYRVTFRDGVTVDRQNKLFADVTDDEFRMIVNGIVAGHAFAEIPGIDVVIKKLDEQVEYIERSLSINGIYRDEPLKKPRVITGIEYSFPEDQLKKLLAFRDHMELLDMPAGEMTIYRTDGSYVTIRSAFGEVSLTDSRHKTTTHKMDVDRFLSRIL